MCKQKYSIVEYYTYTYIVFCLQSLCLVGETDFSMVQLSQSSSKRQNFKQYANLEQRAKFRTSEEGRENKLLGILSRVVQFLKFKNLISERSAIYSPSCDNLVHPSRSNLSGCGNLLKLGVLIKCLEPLRFICLRGKSYGWKSAGESAK